MTETTKDRYIGKKIEGYSIVRLIGRGGMGSVYEGYDSGLKRTVAIKILDQEASGDDLLVKRFEREAKILAGFDHPNIARIYRYGSVDGCPYYVMELIEGKSFADLLRERGNIGGTAVVDYMIQAAKGLKKAAEHHIIHRDVKPANLMLSKDGLVKILDFGIAKDCDDETFKTTTGAVMGTPRYICPEQARGAKVDTRSDIYSLGATFYHLIAGVPPFDSDNPFTLLKMHCTDPVRAITEFRASVPEPLCSIIYSMLEKNPADRVQDYTQLIVMLENVFGPKSSGIQSYKVAPKTPAHSTEPAATGMAKYAWIAIVVFIVLGAIGLIFSPKDDDSKASTTNGPSFPAPVIGNTGHGGLRDTIGALRDIAEIQKELHEEVENPE